jgi:general secretion pathway protein D
MLAGLIRDEERTVLAGIPGLVDLPFFGKFFANNRRETTETDIVLTLTPHIVRVLDLSESDLRPFRLGRDLPPSGDVPAAPPRDPMPRDRDFDPAASPRGDAPVLQPSAPTFPQPLQPAITFPQPLQGPLPGGSMPIVTPPPPPKKPGGGG